MTLARLAALAPLSLLLAVAPPQDLRRFPATGFDAIEVRGSDDVAITVGGAFAVSASGDPRAVAALSIAVRGSVLHVARRPGTYRDGGATIAVTLPALTAIGASGSGDVTARGVRGARFTARLAGSGTLRVDGLRASDARIELAGSGDAFVRGVDADAVALALRGSGDVVAAGRARRVAATVAGSGDLDVRDLAAIDLSASLAGSGGLRTRASTSASISAHGIGRVVVTGGARCTVAKSRTADVSCG